jgi:hypothetical protein
VAQLPSHAQLFYPFVLSKRSGFHMELMDLMPSLCDEGVGPTGISKLIREFHTKELVFAIYTCLIRLMVNFFKDMPGRRLPIILHF